MSNDLINSLKELTLEEKLEMAQFLWEDVAENQNLIKVPADHELILNERLEKIALNKTTFKNWEDLKSKYV